MSRILSLLLLLVIAGSTCAQGPNEPLVKKVKTSIHKGVRFLISKQRGDGGWEDLTGNGAKSDQIGGPSALALLALLNCDGVIDDPDLEQQRHKAIERALAQVRTIETTRVYVKALQAMALAEAKKPQDIKLINANVQWLLEARVYKGDKFIGWTYGKHVTDRVSDASNSQYAMLALWYARQAGIPIDRGVWEQIRDYYTRTQSRDGSWPYSTDYDPDQGRPSVTMTVAGLCGLAIAGMELNAGREQKLPDGRFKNCGDYQENAPSAAATKWVVDKFKIDLTDRVYYHLYGIERAGRLTGQRFFGEHDWYREGCEFLVKRQDPEGAWPSKFGHDRWPHINTSFAVLFLSKGRTPVVISKLVHGNWPRVEWDLDWNNDRNDLRHLTEDISRKGLFDKKPVAWQTYDVTRALYANTDKPTKDDETAVVADMLQSPILYITGHKNVRLRIRDNETALIKRYVESGGFLLAEACCGDPNFDAGIKEWVKENWPGHELTYLESTHPVWTCNDIVPAGAPYKLMGLQVGCRTIMLYSPQDLSCYWEAGLPSPSGRGVGGEGNAQTQLAFRLGGNIIAYATGKTPPLPRLTPVEIASEKSIASQRKRGVFQIGQIRYRSDDWQPAPKAMVNLMRNVHEVRGLDVDLKTVQIKLDDRYEGGRSVALDYKFLYMHGRKEIRSVEPDDLAQLRFSLEHGGLLFADACCGNEVFDKSFRKFAQELFSKDKLQRVPATDRLFSGLPLDKIKCRIKANGPMLKMEPYLEGVQINGRWVVLYSRYDIGCALERNTSADCVGYDPHSAMHIATAAVLYNVTP
jgi:hypothetical protein